MKLWEITVMSAAGGSRKVTRYAETVAEAIAGVSVAPWELITDCVPAEVGKR